MSYSEGMSKIATGAAFDGEPFFPPRYNSDRYNSDVIFDWLNFVAEGRDRYYNLSHVFSSVVLYSRRASGKRDTAYLSPTQSERILAALRAARAANPSMFWEDNQVTRQITRHGFDTLEKLIELWAFDLFGPQPSDDERRDIYDHARIFQNLMHNISLAEEIEERMKERAAKDVAEIRSMALGTTV